MESHPAFIADPDGGFRLQSALTFATVPALWRPGAERIAAAADGDLQFDLQQVQAADSAGLALLIDWLAVARAQRRSLRYAQVPEALRALARLSDVAALLVREAAPSAQ